jgi:predicted dithiol-disulfide oxidoreductase (DUF899 family)
MTGSRLPGESAAYRAARDELTAAEHDLTAAIEKVAAMRRALPPGGLVPEDYVFTEGPDDLERDLPERQVPLSELFGGHDTLVLYSFMYGPLMEQACSMCTSLVDGLNGSAPDIARQVSLAVVASSPLARIRGYARDRGWDQLRLLSSAGTRYNRDYLAEAAGGEQRSVLNVFSRREGGIRHFYATEKGPTGPGQDDRHVDLVWPLWNVLDLTPGGRPPSWRPGS